ncbi:MAG: hypothetical protein EA418_03055 [Wenzhouxiangellaceae bacterium]|nr:MAG: hypothetical protein EA418_03055 [Wenzhouxiangellaceae bacterium]
MLKKTFSLLLLMLVLTPLPPGPPPGPGSAAPAPGASLATGATVWAGCPGSYDRSVNSPGVLEVSIDPVVVGEHRGAAVGLSAMLLDSILKSGFHLPGNLFDCRFNDYLWQLRDLERS